MALTDDPQQTLTADDPKTQPDVVVDIPGVGPTSFPASMGLQGIRDSAIAKQRDAAQEARRVPVGARGSGFSEDRAIRMTDNPELWSGVASLIPGVGPGIGGAVGAGTSVARDLAHGDTDTAGMTARALGHGLAGAIPAGVGNLVEKGAGAVFGDMAGAALTGGKLGWLKSLLASTLKGGAPEATNAATAAVAPAVTAGLGDLATATLPGGIKLVSSDGLKYLTQKSIELENAGGNPQTIAALDGMIKQVASAVEAQKGVPSNILSRAGVGFTTAADVARNAANQAAGDAAAAGASVAKRLRLALGLGSEAATATGMQR